ncbi:MAG: phosphatidylserine decarboxylase [Opitutaceae bacterium]|nr:phosphatidylserine decarboxylase [Opitutaceae bacterium]
MASEPLRYYDRYRKAIRTEAIYGEAWLRWAYESPTGRFATWLVARRPLFSRYFGWRMSMRGSARHVFPFIVDYNLDVEEFAKSAFDFRTFNEFFTRALKPSARPIAEPDNPRLAVFPADGRHLGFANVDDAPGFYVKGAKFTLTELLGDAALGEAFSGGAMVISRLCPVDYHRFHFPVRGLPDDGRMIGKWLYSVSPIALRRNVRRLVENKRRITLVKSEGFGRVALIEVGATNVGSIVETYVPGRVAAKGEEKGLFKFGGSCVITLFERGRIRFDSDLLTQSAAGLELYARMGDRLGIAH